MSGRMEGSFIFDNPVMGREIRIRLRPWKIALFAFIHAAVLVGSLGIAYIIHLEGGSPFEFGQLAFLCVTGTVVLLFTLLGPLSALGFLDRERKDRSLDQFLVSGSSPYWALLGKVAVSFVHQMVLLSVSLPFIILCHALGGVSWGLILGTYGVLALYILFVIAFSVSVTTQVPDLVAAATTGPGILAVIGLTFAKLTPPAMRALNPIHHIVVAFRDAWADMGIGVQDTSFFGYELPTGLLSCGFYVGLSLIACFVALMGPELPLLTGLHVYGEARSTSKKRRRVRSLTTRSSEIAFLYENRPAWMRAQDIVIREGVIAFFLVLLSLGLLGALWPGPTGFFIVDGFVYPYTLFTLVLLPCLSLTGLRGQRVFSRSVQVGKRTLPAIAVSRVAFLVKAAVPLLCFWGALVISGRDPDEFDFAKYTRAYAVAFTFALFLFAIFLSISVVTRSPGKVFLVGSLVGLSVALLPLLWFVGYKAFWWSGESQFAVETSPIIATWGALEPDISIDLRRRQDVGSMRMVWETFDLYPSLWRYLALYIPLSLGAFFISGALIDRSLRKAKVAGVVLLALLIPLTASAQDGDITLELEVGLEGKAISGEEAHLPVAIRLRNGGPDVQGVLAIEHDGWRKVYREEVPLALPQGSEKRISRILPGDNWGDVLAEFRVRNKVLATDRSGIQFVNVSHQGHLAVVLDTRGPLPIPAVADHAFTTRYSTVHPETWTLPDTPEGYLGVRAVMVGRMDPGSLSVAQQRALRIWAERGGTIMVVPVHQRNWKGTFLEDLTGLDGVTLAGEGDLARMARRYQIPFPEQARAPVANLRGIPGEVILAGDSGPLILRVPAGSGQVVLLAFDPWVPPVPGWEGARRLFSDTLGAAAPPGWTSGPPSWVPDLLWRKTDRQGGFGTTILVAILFAIIVGPGGYVVLRRRKRPGLVWVAVPLVSLLAAVCAAAVSSLYGRIPSTCNSATVLRLHPGSRRGTAFRFLLYQSRARERHRVVLEGKALAGFTTRSRWPGSESLHLGREGEDRWEIDPLRVPRWRSTMVHARCDFALDGPVTARVLAGKDRITLRVENRSSLDLRDVIIDSPGLWRSMHSWRVGSIAAGSSAEVVLLEKKEGIWTLATEYPSTPAMSVETRDFFLWRPGGGMFSPPDLTARVDAAEANRFIRATFDTLTEPAGTFGFLSVPMQWEHGEDGTFGETLRDPRTFPIGDPSGAEEYFVVWEFRLRDVPGTLQVDRMELAGAGREKPEIYDWEGQAWVSVESVTTKLEPQFEGQPPDRLVGADPGRFLLQPEGIIAIRRAYAPQTYVGSHNAPFHMIEVEGTVEPADSQ